jgi:hypothetical protein
MHGIFFHESFTAKGVEQTLIDFRKFTGRQLADFAAKHLPRAFSEVFEQRAGTDRERRSGGPSWIICMPTRVARGWSGRRSIGGIRPQRIGCWGMSRRRMCR